MLIELVKTISVGEDDGTGTPSPVTQWSAVLQDDQGNDILDNTGAQQTFDLYFDQAGQLCDATGAPLASDQMVNFEWDMQGDATFDSFTVDLGGVTRTGVTGYSGSTTISITEQDGYQAGVVVGYAVDQNGVLELHFSNDQQVKMFQLAIGQVTNASGLEQVGENFYALTNASGELHLRQAGRESRAVVVAGTLEMSNVDLATEFTDMIVAQRGFQAAARVITSSDEMLQETVSIKR
jgi:flagellar hook protein FlgE